LTELKEDRDKLSDHVLNSLCSQCEKKYSPEKSGNKENYEPKKKTDCATEKKLPEPTSVLSPSKIILAPASQCIVSNEEQYFQNSYKVIPETAVILSDEEGNESSDDIIDSSDVEESNSKYLNLTVKQPKSQDKKEPTVSEATQHSPIIGRNSGRNSPFNEKARKILTYTTENTPNCKPSSSTTQGSGKTSSKFSLLNTVPQNRSVLNTSQQSDTSDICTPSPSLVDFIPRRQKKRPNSPSSNASVQLTKQRSTEKISDGINMEDFKPSGKLPRQNASSVSPTDLANGKKSSGSCRNMKMEDSREISPTVRPTSLFTKSKASVYKIEIDSSASSKKCYRQTKLTAQSFLGNGKKKNSQAHAINSQSDPILLEALQQSKESKRIEDRKRIQLSHPALKSYAKSKMRLPTNVNIGNFVILCCFSINIYPFLFIIYHYLSFLIYHLSLFILYHYLSFIFIGNMEVSPCSSLLTETALLRAINQTSQDLSSDVTGNSPRKQEEKTINKEISSVKNSKRVDLSDSPPVAHKFSLPKKHKRKSPEEDEMGSKKKMKRQRELLDDR